MSSSGRAVTLNAPGSFVGRIAYSPFGLIRSFTGGLTTDKRFTGQRLDDTGLYYYNARYYDATIGRFMSADTIVPDPYDPQCLNRYTYVLNNPLKYTDPSGHFLDTLFDIVSIVADVVDIVRNPTSGWGWGSLGADVVCAFVPFVAGGGAAVRGAKITTKIVNRMDDASDAVKAVDRTHDYAKTIGMSWDAAKQAENAHDYAKTIDKAWDAGNKSALRGSRNPIVARALDRGKQAHLALKQRVEAKGWAYAPTIRGKNGRLYRPDVVTSHRRILELKPFTPSGITAGIRQKAIYEAQLNMSVKVIYYMP